MDIDYGGQAAPLLNNGVLPFCPPLVLASASPRRAEILRAVDWPFTTLPVEIDESLREGEAAADYVNRLAMEKALAAAASVETGLVLGADTTVVVAEEILAKPADLGDAAAMLRKLSGRWHEVLTGIAIADASRQVVLEVACERTAVLFAEMDAAEIEWHTRNGNPLDKAGGYAIQEHAALFITEIRGDYWNVVGLPVQLLYRLVKQIINSENEKPAST